MAFKNESGQPHGIPVPDPTVLTTEQLERAIAGLRALLTAEQVGQRELFDARLTGMDRAIALLAVGNDKTHDEFNERIVNLRTLHDEKFMSIQTQFAERDVRTEQSAKDQKVAVDAALQAQKESVGAQNTANSLANNKMEFNFTKLIDQLGVLITTTTKTTDDKIDDIKQRLTTIEGRANGVQGSSDNSRANMALIVSCIIGAVILLQGLATFFHVLLPAAPVK
jgi:Asp-tRNA(Asn)/Glu-tRNA(Gln) amidotransferase A subunit family amidase